VAGDFRHKPCFLQREIARIISPTDAPQCRCKLIPAPPRHPIENETDFLGTKQILPEQSRFARNKADLRGTKRKSVGFSDMTGITNWIFRLS
jgi:hypothetical protein